MNNRITQLILVLVTCGAVAFAAYSFITNQPAATPSPTPTPATTATPSATPAPDTSPILSPSIDPARVFTDKQGLSLPNTLATLAQGSSLFDLAQKHDMSIEAISKLNSIDNPNSVFAGQSLIIPDDLTTDTYTVLFVLNPKRLEKEKKSIANGGSSLYSDAVTAAQTDLKGIYKLAADTPYSKSQETDAKVVLTTSDADKVITVTLEKDASTLWVVKKVTIKITKATT